MKFHPEMKGFLKSIATQNIPENRKKTLQQLAALINEVKEANGHVNLNFICTHNSRRSQMAELTMRLFAFKHDLDFISTYSGGTEATALNHRVVNALESHGFQVTVAEEGENPIYAINFSEERDEEPAMFSKTFDDESSPEKMIAVMVCGDAEENCPFIPAAEHRFALTYEDPKFSDDTAEEELVYQNKVLEISSEMNFLCEQITL